MTDHTTRDEIERVLVARLDEWFEMTASEQTANLLAPFLADALIAAGLVVPAGPTDPDAEWGMNARNMRKIVNGLRHPKPPPTGDWCATSHAIELLESWADALELRETPE